MLDSAFEVSVPEPIYVFGDSHSETFSGRTYRVGDRQFVFRPLYVPYVQAKSFEAKPGKLSRTLQNALVRAGLAVVTFENTVEPLHTTSDAHWKHVAVVRGFSHSDPRFVFALGSVDLLQLSREELEAYDSIAVDSSDDASSISFAKAVELFRVRMQPFEMAVATMRTMEFARSSILSLVPFSSVDGQYQNSVDNLGLSQKESHLRPAWRAQLAKVGDATLATIAERSGIPFIRRRIDHDVLGNAAPAALRDGIHLEAVHRDRSAVAIIDAIGELPEGLKMPQTPQFYQVKLEDGSSSYALTVAEESFAAIQEAQDDRLFALHDVNTGDVVWTNRRRIINVTPIR